MFDGAREMGDHLVPDPRRPILLSLRSPTVEAAIVAGARREVAAIGTVAEDALL